MSNDKVTYAYIDGNNLRLSAKGMGWILDERKFRILLSDLYNVTVAYYFIGYIEEYKYIYTRLTKYGYKVVNFMPTILPDKTYKGNCDGYLICQAMAELNKYEKAVIVTSDGDYELLVEHLRINDKLERVIGCSRGGCAGKLKRVAKTQIDFLDDFRNKVEYIREGTP